MDQKFDPSPKDFRLKYVNMDQTWTTGIAITALACAKPLLVKYSIDAHL